MRRIAVVAILAGIFAALPLGAAAEAAAPAPPAAPPSPAPPVGSKQAAKPTAPIGKPGAPYINTKPKASGVFKPNTAWRVTLTASETYLWPTRYTTLTATANQDLASTYSLSIYDGNADAFIAICNVGTTCSVATTKATETYDYFYAMVSDWPTAYPPANVRAYANVATVFWHATTIFMSASPPTLPVNGIATLTVTTTDDMGPSPYWMEIYDATTGTRLTYCGYGTSCTVTTTQSVATTHAFVGYVSDLSAAFPPTGIVRTSTTNYVTWNNAGFTVSLSAPSATYGTETVTATTNMSITPTSSFIEIFNDGVLLTACNLGTTCSFTFTASSYGLHHLVAFVSNFDYGFLPGSIVANSSSVDFTYFAPLP